jgi:hyperosmotically inducible protein
MHTAKRVTWVLAALLGGALAACTSTPTQQSAGEAIDDGVVTAKVKAALIEDPLTKAHQIDVETFKGTVQLSGFVEDDKARTRALQLTREIDGVRRVKDAMEVRDSTT